MTIAEFCTANKIPKSTARARLTVARKTDASIATFLGSREVQPREKTIILGVTTRTKTAQKPTASRAKSSPNPAQHLRAEVQVFAHDFTRKIEPETAQDLSAKVAQEPRENDAQNEPNPAQEPTPEPAQTRATFDGHFLRTDAFLFVTLCAAMIGQMAHTSWVFYRNIPEEQPLELRVILAIVCAIGVDCTALVMTVKRGGMGYLITFALIHFAINLTAHFQDSEEVGWGGGLVFILLSGVLAFSNFSYTDLFSRK